MAIVIYGINHWYSCFWNSNRLKGSKILMPAIFIILLILIVRGLTLEVQEQIKFLFKTRFF